ncbi:MAG TPA: type VI secretion system lipoprotein TssJ [Polyangiaceae bacterium]|nr:type VI secretion system lipoprotein TssJ [Polyangiaceae bacterium]
MRPASAAFARGAPPALARVRVGALALARAEVGALIVARAGVSALALALAAGCASTPPPAAPEPKVCDTQRVSLSILAAPELNPTLDGESRPVVFRVYQLKSDVRFQNASFHEIWKDSAKVLGDDLVDGKKDERDREVAVYPGVRHEVKFERDPDAQVVVAAALFRNPVGRTWYMAYELPPMPGKGDCHAPACEGDGGACAIDRANPRFSIWAEGTHVDDGTGREDELPEGGRRARLIHLASAPVEGAESPAPAAKPTARSAPAAGARSAPPGATARTGGR